VGIILEDLDVNEDPLVEELAEETQNGRYFLGRYSLHWSLAFAANTITLNLVDLYGSAITTRVITRK